MSTTIVLYSAGQELQRREFSPQIKMVDAISAVLSASNLEVSLGSCRVVTADYGDIVRVTPDRLLGTESLNVEGTNGANNGVTEPLVIPNGAVASLLAQASALRAEINIMQKAIAATARDPLRAVAAQVLEAAFGSTTPDRHRDLPYDNPVLAKLARMASSRPADFPKLADDLFTGRSNNDGVHWTSIAALDSKVESCQGLLAMPGARQACELEAWIVENYGAIKDAFPAQFGMQA